MKGWRDTTMGELVKIEHGFAFKGEYFSDAGELVVLTPGNFHEEGGFKARPDKDRFYQGRFPDRYLLSRNDLIVAMTEQGEGLLGSSALIPESGKYLHNQRIGLVRLRNDSADKIFLYYLFNADYVRQQIRNTSSGAKIRHTSPERICRTKVRIPAKDCQTKIAAILSTYDELIENNSRRIAVLEKVAEGIFREWFFRLRFPGNKKAKMYRRVPDGWREAKLGDLIPDKGLQTGKRPKGGAQESGVPSIGAENVIGLAQHKFSKEKYVSEQFFDSMRQGHVEDKDILFYKDGAEIGRVTLVQDGFPHTRCGVNEHVFLIRTRDLNAQYFLYFYLSQPGIQEYIKTINKNAAQPGINKVELRSIPILLPDRALIAEFETLASPIIRQVFQLAKTRRLLSEMRDLLLPRLISGKLSVENLDIRFPPGMTKELNFESTAAIHA